ncbi:hypothetical protein EYF80_064221 [Liparis tanakae]|uniref:Uncharacterized protein n=1 Tax=Liparis tanakae TaxID=230148 RepID=A0A4Z2E9Z6_9TELE|nr:hypothetical protein EYF80_064221 [Liparis tanakae]
MELGGLSLAAGTEVSLSFSTLADTGTIMLAVGGASPIGQQVRNTNLLSSKRRRRQSGEVSTWRHAYTSNGCSPLPNDAFISAY